MLNANQSLPLIVTINRTAMVLVPLDRLRNILFKYLKNGKFRLGDPNQSNEL